VLLMNICVPLIDMKHPAAGVRPQEGRTRHERSAHCPRPGIQRAHCRHPVRTGHSAVVFTALMAGTYKRHRHRSGQRREEKLKLIGEVLPPACYDNDLLADWVDLPRAELGLDEDDPCLPRAQGRPAGRAGAGGDRARRLQRPHRLIVAVGADGRLSACGHVAQGNAGPGRLHRPEEGPQQDRPGSPSSMASASTACRGQLASVKKDGGRFDQMTGATISARAVTNAAAAPWPSPPTTATACSPAGGNGRLKQGAKP
jgi:electron transport complex protein RnfG